MGFLLRNHYISPDPVPAFSDDSFFGSVEAVQKWRDVEEYMIIKQAGRPIGASLTEIRQVDDSDTTLTYEADFRLSVKLSPILPQIIVKGKSLLNKQMQLSSFYAFADVGPADFSATGLFLNNTLYLRTDKPAETSLQRIRLDRAISLAEAVRPAMGSQLTIAPGNSLRTPVIDPLTGQNRGTLTITVKDQETVTIGNKNVKAYRVVSALQDIESVMWVDAYGQTLKRNLVGDITMERASLKEVLQVAPALEEDTEIPELDLADFRSVPIQQGSRPEGESSNTAINALRTLLQ